MLPNKIVTSMSNTIWVLLYGEERPEWFNKKCYMSAIIAGVFLAVAYAFAAIGNGFLKLGPLGFGFLFSIGLLAIVFIKGTLYTGCCLSLSMIIHSKFLDRNREKDDTNNVKHTGVFTFGLLTLIFNFIGSLLIVVMLYFTSAFSNKFFTAVIEKNIHTRLSTPYLYVFMGAILCNMLVCCAIWIANKEGVSDIVKFLFVAGFVTAFVTCGFPHSIADMTLYLSGIFKGYIDIANATILLLITVIGNTVGGVIIGHFVWATERTE